MTLNVKITSGDGEIPLTLYYLSKYVLGYDKMCDVHKRWGDSYETARKNGTKRFLIMRPRASYKTSFYTVSGVIDLLIEDFIENNCQITKSILIVSATDTLASNILGEIHQHLVTNETLLDIFDPERKGFLDKETKTEIKFKNSKIMKESNITSAGALASIVSSHYDIIICDDLSNQDDRESITIRERKCRNYVDLISILKQDGLLVCLGTKWADGDVLSSIQETNEQLPESAKYHVEIDGVYNDDGSLRYPTIYDEDDLARLKIEKGKVEFAAQYLNVLLSEDTMIFNLNEFAFYKEGDLRSQYKIDFKECPHYMYVDPSLGREQDSCVIIIGAVHDKNLYIRDVVMSNAIKPSRLTKIVYKKYKEYHCRMCGFETNGFQSLMVDNIYDYDKKINGKRKINIQEVKNYKKKEVRIESVEPFVTAGRIIFRDDWDRKYPKFIEEVCKYPVAKHDDAPDALEGICRMTINKKTNVTNRNKKLANFARGIKRAVGIKS